MNLKKSCNPAMKNLQGFTLIELLVVIAIISLLAALLFPVFATAQENSRQTSTMTHLQQIQSAIALYKLDNQAYPQVLYGYADPGHPMSDAYDIAKNDSTNNVGSLFPTYISDYHVFMSYDNPIDNSTSQYVNLTSLEISPTSTSTYPTLQPVSRSFYVMDGFDVSPQLSTSGSSFVGGNSPANLRYVLRYQRDWTSIQDLNCPSTGSQTACTDQISGTGYEYNDPTHPYYGYYLHQLRWKNPPADSYVTSTTYHVPTGGKIIALFESGSVVKISQSQLGGYNDSASCSNKSAVTGTPPAAETCTLDANNDNPAQFWKMANSQ